MQVKRYGKRIIGIAALALAVALVVAFAVFVNGSYRADETAWEAIRTPHEGVIVTERDGTLFFVPDGAATGLVFYPGGRVQAEAYAPLMMACAERGVACALVQMPCNLAVMDFNAADRVFEPAPDIPNWYIGGHSLGGAVAALYAAGHTDRVQGVVLLGAYATSPLSMPVLSIYGSEDQVLNREKYAQYRSNLPTFKFPRQNHAFRTQLAPRIDCGDVYDVRLRADVYGKIRRNLPRRRERSQIGDKNRIHAYVRQKPQIFFQAREIFVARVHVRRRINFLAPLVDVSRRLRQLVVGKIFRKRA